jgi:eukaryotic-like serine/threonine-protein kinase
MQGEISIGRAKPAERGMSRETALEDKVGCATPMAPLSWSASLGPDPSLDISDSTTEIGPRPTIPAKDVAEDPTLTHPFRVPEAHAGMMVTPSVKLVRPLGEGGMGAVWVADHLALHTQVVVKFMASGLKDSKEARERFSREAAAAAQVKSPHVVQTFDHGVTSDGTPYIVMELLEGRDLGGFLHAEGRCSPELTLEIVAQLARALDRAHERGIVHRDIKPGNIFLCDGGNEVFVKLLDFGIAKGVDVPQLDSGTKTGAMVGSPFYMSPEQILGSKGVDHRSDLWSVGVVAYEALTGQKPFDAETMGGLAIRIHSEPLPAPSTINPSLPPAVDAWFSRACARASSERFGSAKEMAATLAGALGGEMPRSVDVPRVSTGANGNNQPQQPALATGATTEAGLARSAPRASARNRVVALVVSASVLFLASFLVVNTLNKRNAQPTARTATAEPPARASAAEQGGARVLESDAKRALTRERAALLPTTSSPTKVGETPQAPSPPSSSDPVASADPQATHPPTTKLAGHGARPAKPPATSPSSRLPLPSATPPPPAPTGHDIF